MRLATLRGYRILDTPFESAYDDVTRLIAHICQTPVALVSLVDERRQWFKSAYGMDVRETSRDLSICSHAILEPGLFEVPDTLLDSRFADNPLVSGAPYVRFYAGAPLEGVDGQPLGTLCVLDYEARELTASQRDALQTLARHVTTLLELRRSHDALSLAEAERQLVLEAAGLATWSWEPGGSPTGCDPLPRVHPKDRRRVLAALTHAYQRDEGLEVECRLDQPTDSPRWAILWGRTLPADTGLRGLHGVVLDVTERRVEEQRRRDAQRLQSIGTLAGGVAHEVNNMMSVVLGFGEFALAGLGPSHAQTADVEEMVRAARRAARITQQLLAFSRQAMLQPSALDLNEVIRSLLPLLEQIVGADKIIDLVLSPDAPAVHADRVQLEQVLVNLALNARDAMPDGGRLTVETVPDPDPDPGLTDAPTGYVRVVVRDTGTGMDAETLARAFEPFFTTKPMGQGTGLGLSTVHGVVSQSGGSVRLESAPGVGTAVHVLLPVIAPPAHPDSDETRSSSEGSEVILVAEDEPAVRTLARRALEAQGYTVLEAANGREALDVLAHGPCAVDLVLCDVVMPVTGGAEVGRQVAERWPSIPLLFMSGYPGDEMVDRNLVEAGAPFLQKPFTPESLAAAVRYQLDESLARVRED